MLRPISARQAPAARRWVTLLIVIAFFLQSLAVQTHIHPQATGPAAAARVSHISLPASDNSPIPFEQSGCRLCQEMAHFGAVITPFGSSLLVSLSFIAVAFTGPPLCGALLASAFAWKSRAPPRR